MPCDLLPSFELGSVDLFAENKIISDVSFLLTWLTWLMSKTEPPGMLSETKTTLHLQLLSRAIMRPI